MNSPARRVWTGWWIVGVGTLHLVFGVVTYWRGWSEIGRRGWWHAVDGDVVREHAFWFTFAGPMMILAGSLMIWIERRAALAPPRYLGWTFLATAATMGLLMPASGFWLLIPPGIALLRKR